MKLVGRDEFRDLKADLSQALDRMNCIENKMRSFDRLISTVKESSYNEGWKDRKMSEMSARYGGCAGTASNKWTIYLYNCKLPVAKTIIEITEEYFYSSKKVEGTIKISEKLLRLLQEEVYGNSYLDLVKMARNGGLQIETPYGIVHVQSMLPAKSTYDAVGIFMRME